MEWLLACCQSGSHVDTAEYTVALELPQREGEEQAGGGTGADLHKGEVEENEDDIMQLYMGGGAGGGEEKGGLIHDCLEYISTHIGH